MWIYYLILSILVLPVSYSGNLTCYSCHNIMECNSLKQADLSMYCANAEACSWVVKQKNIILRGCVGDGFLQNFHKAQKDANMLDLGHIFTCVSNLCNYGNNAYIKRLTLFSFVVMINL